MSMEDWTSNLFEEIRRMRRDMDRMWESFFGERMRLPYRGAAGTELERYREPLVDVTDLDNAIIVTAEMPGVNKENIQLNVIDNSLEIKSESRKEAKEEKEGYIRREKRYAGFYRRIPLPVRVNRERVKATFNNGILEVTLPKAEEEKRHPIKVE